MSSKKKQARSCSSSVLSLLKNLCQKISGVFFLKHFPDVNLDLPISSRKKKTISTWVAAHDTGSDG